MVPPSKYSASGPIMMLVTILVLVAVAMAGDHYDENVLYGGQRLKVGQELRWGDYDFRVIDKCYVHIAESNVRVIWQAGTGGSGPYCSLHMQMDGNLVLTSGKSIVWQTNTRGEPGENVCLLRQDGNLAIYGSPTWSTRKPYHPASTPAAALEREKTPTSTKLRAQSTSATYVQNVLYEGESLLAGQELRAKSYRFVMQEDCNLVLYNDYDSLWTSDTSGRGQNCYLELKRNGNLIIYDHWGYPVWHSETARRDGEYVLIVHDTGAVVLYSKALWSRPNAVSSGLTTTSNSSTVAYQGRKTKIAMVAAVNRE